jgi:predicted phage terminase large subunit-like protein
VKLTEDQNTKGYFVNSAGGMRMSSTVGGKSPIGFHGHFLIVDDPLDPQAAVSELELKSANDWMNDTLPSRKIDKMVVPTILIMQRLHQNDPTGNRLAKGVKDLKHIRLPADCTQFVVAPKMLRDHYVDNLMDPVRMPRQFLNEELKLHGEYYVAGQYGQNPVPLGGAMFKVDCLTVDQAPLLSEFKWVYRYWDKAGTAGRGAYTVGCKMGVTFDDRFWILDIVRGQWEAAKRDRIIRNTAVKDGKNVIIAVEQEPGSGGKDSASATVRSLAGYKVVLDKPTSSDSSKELRAEPFSGQVNSYNVYVQKAHWNNDYIEELKFFPASTFKDQVDASSGAFNLLAVGRRRVGAL